MHAVYKNAICNISASGFSDGVEGFLSTKRRIDPVPVNVPLSHQFPETKCSTAQNNSKKSYCVMNAEPWNELRRSPIFLRAWTLQEQLLVSVPDEIQLRSQSDCQSIRNIHFNDDQVYQECKFTVANEVWPYVWAEFPLKKQFQSSMINTSWMFRLRDVPYNDISFNCVDRESKVASAG